MKEDRVAMELVGKITANRPLLVAAVEEWARFLDADPLRALTGETYGAALTLSVDGGPVLATGDAAKRIGTTSHGTR
jgi:hypothetical protein